MQEAVLKLRAGDDRLIRSILSKASESEWDMPSIINALELIPSETGIAKAGILDGARIAWADKLNVPESSISDQSALQGIIFLNEDQTIERVI